MFGKDVIWAAENLEVVYELICKFWSKEDYKFNPQFIQLQQQQSRSQSHHSLPQFHSFHSSSALNLNPHLHSSPIQLSSSENGLEDPTAKPKKRVFKFSHQVSDGPPDIVSKAVQSGPIHSTNLAREGLSCVTLQHASSNHQPLGVKILTEANENLINSEEQPEDCEEAEDKQPTPSNSPHRQSLPLTTPRSFSTRTSFDTLPNALESPSPTQSTLPTQPSSPPPSTLFRVSRSTSQTSESLHSPSSLSSTANSIRSTEHSSTPNLLRTTPPTITTTNHTEPILSQSQSSCSSRSSLIFKSEKTRFAQSPKMTSVTTTTSSFKARPLPASNAQPDSSPRMSKAAMLRLGLPWTPPTRSVSPSGTPESETPRVIPSVASLNPPTVAPRATKASTLRADGILPVDSNQPRVKKTESEIFENTPGHSFRRRSLIIPSIASPKTVPRANKSSALRAGESIMSNPKEKREKVNEKEIFNGTPGHKRNEKIEVKSNRPPEVEVRPTRSSTLRALSDSTTSLTNQVNGSKNGLKKSQRSQAIDKRTSFEGVPGHKRSIPIPVAVLQKPPSTLPRMNYEG
ncbi:uncharacterized protein MELLADRAFT_90468 [Melampsora larici-populina 98AG31]|uniref:Uncharacterized protein n=1 Tax=Melampsora larici-populina (strain 98AG31 / pathotype 3-4-7) TaxID=747676 RepID=F4RX22_MELLP|nr:uncharacterized protein MELLADRAFT_90468 [Melampsora larici-populina 98AG31]EGG03119.1 hypothetical protein MELLADRAFT_90468 [Melampsora larici-populina 98AG31]